ncbi:MAG TPA: TonB-dependent receptor [Steroidobacteraceae bacterium]|nr:TonB-dependent receptor [Steroidobacteraceae bacterium]
MIGIAPAGRPTELARALARRLRSQPRGTLSCVTAAVLAAMYGPAGAADEPPAVPAAASVIANAQPPAGKRSAAVADRRTLIAANTRPLGAAGTQRLAAAGTSAPLTAANAPSAAGGGAIALPEVTVTATRRAEAAQSLPMSITAISGQNLQASGIEDMAGLAQSMAGVNFTDQGPFSGVKGSGLIIRGLNSEGTGGQLGLATPVQPPVATYVDDTPLYFAMQLLDLNRVEILAGPQGTLYGSGSLGGTIRFVQNAPDPSGFDAKAEVGSSDTYHTHAPNDVVNAMLNLPLTDTWAVRADVGYNYDAGFINQPNLYVLNTQGVPISAEPGNVFSPPVKYAQDGTNWYYYHAARIATLWKPNDAFQAELNFYYQLGVAGGFPYVATSDAAYNQPLGPLAPCAVTCTNPSPVSQLYSAPVPPGVDALSNADNALDTAHDAIEVYALTLNYDMGFATLTSDTSWGMHVNHSTDDLTSLYTNFPFFQSIYGQDPRSFVIGRDELSDKPFSQELRLASKLGGLFDWVGGLFFEDEKQDIQEHEFFPGYLDFFNGCSATYGAETTYQYENDIASYCGVGETAYSPTTTNEVDGIPIIKDQTYIGDFETKFRDIAAFGELTAHVTKNWSLTGGTRVFRQTVSQAQQTGLLFDGGGVFLEVPPPPIANESLSDSWDKAIWKLNTSYQLNPTNLVYATWSQGFRRGGVNALPPAEPAENYVTPAALTKLQPDTADNYEIGVKGTIHGRYQYSADVFYIQWHNVQEGVQLTPLVLPASLNVGDAFSRGVEMQLDALFTSHWSATVDYTYDQTRMTSINPLDVNMSVPPPIVGMPLPGTPKNSLALGPAWQTELGPGVLRYGIDAHYQSRLLPALSTTVPTVAGFTTVNMRVSYQWSHWMTTLYGNNVGNVLGITSYQDPYLYGNRDEATITTPRTIGFTLDYSFKGM